MGAYNNIAASPDKSPTAFSTSGIRGLPTWFPFLGWVVAALLFCFISLGYDVNLFRQAGAEGRAYLSSFSPASLGTSKLLLNQSGTQSGNHSDQVLRQPVQQPGAWPKITEDHSYCQLKSANDFLTEYHLLDCASRVAREHEHDVPVLGENATQPHPRIAFLFLTRGELPHEPVWRRFFHGHDKYYSLYAHTDPKFKFNKKSLFHKHQVPSRNVERFSINLVDAMRRVLAYAVLDPKYGPTNSWFVFICEATIPIRSFNFTYNYLSGSEHSFVESFKPDKGYLNWDAKPYFTRQQLRKGELWMALNRRHALTVLEDWSIYYKFKAFCTKWCTPDEQYIQTLLALADPMGIENRTVMYVDWAFLHEGSPRTFTPNNMTVSWFKELQGRTVDRDGEFHDSSMLATTRNVTSKICSYNGVPNSPCFLFARKIAKESVGYLNSLPRNVLGY